MGLQVLVAYTVDLLVGDPRFVPHPVVLIGNFISWLETVVRKSIYSPRGLRVAGTLVVVIVVGSSYILTLLLLKLLSSIHPLWAYITGIWLISTSLAARGLAQVAHELRILLARGNLGMARRQVGMVVGRDSACMSSADMARAAVETVAENTVDAVVAPLFYAFIAGPPGAVAYRAVNTLDSMLGYKDDRYGDLGWASAKFDDLINFIPARLTGLLMLCAAWLTGRDIKGAVKAWLADSGKHPSPNAGIPESVVAGSLEVRLGGLNYYRGQPSFRAYMGSSSSNVLPHHIRSTVDMMFLTSFLAVLSGLSIYLLLRM